MEFGRGLAQTLRVSCWLEGLAGAGGSAYKAPGSRGCDWCWPPPGGQILSRRMSAQGCLRILSGSGLPRRLRDLRESGRHCRIFCDLDSEFTRCRCHCVLLIVPVQFSEEGDATRGRLVQLLCALCLRQCRRGEETQPVFWTLNRFHHSDF